MLVLQTVSYSDGAKLNWETSHAYVTQVPGKDGLGFCILPPSDRRPELICSIWILSVWRCAVRFFNLQSVCNFFVSLSSSFAVFCTLWQRTTRPKKRWVAFYSTWHTTIYWLAFSLKFILRLSELDVLHCITGSVTSSLYKRENRRALHAFICKFNSFYYWCLASCWTLPASQCHQCMNCWQHAWIFLPQVTISLAMTIVSLLATFWTIVHLSSVIEHSGIHYRHLEYLEENSTESENLWSEHFAVSHRTVIISVYIHKREGQVKGGQFWLLTSTPSQLLDTC